MGSRTWIKIYCDKWLNGTIREESLEFRAVWIDLLVLAGSGKYGDSGEIKITDQLGFLDEQIATLLQISRQKWVAYKKKLVETDRVYLKNSNIICITNWSKYQSEYDRVRQYPKADHEAEPTVKTTAKTTTKDTRIERDRDKRIEKEKEIEIDPPIVPPGRLSLDSVINAFQDNILMGATVTEEMEQELKGACNRYGTQWVADAIKEAVMRNQLKWRYIAGVLQNWKKEGKS